MIYVLALIAKVMGAKFMKDVKWSYFLIVPLVLVLIRVVWPIISFLMSVTWFFMMADLALWMAGKVFDFEWPLYTLLITKMIFMGLLGMPV